MELNYLNWQIEHTYYVDFIATVNEIFERWDWINSESWGTNFTQLIFEGQIERWLIVESWNLKDQNCIESKRKIRR